MVPVIVAVLTCAQPGVHEDDKSFDHTEETGDVPPVVKSVKISGAARPGVGSISIVGRVVSLWTRVPHSIGLALAPPSNDRKRWPLTPFSKSVVLNASV